MTRVKHDKRMDICFHVVQFEKMDNVVETQIVP